MATTTIIEYLDGTSNSVTVSLFDKMQAEKYGKAAGWGNVQESPIESFTYATYFALRRSHQLTDGQCFEDWAQTVEDIDQRRETDTPLPAGPPEASLS